MTIKKFYINLQDILDHYYDSGNYEYNRKRIIILVAYAKDAGLDVNTSVDILDKITPCSSYDDDVESSYDD
jgi:hypothetical protein